MCVCVYIYMYKVIPYTYNDTYACVQLKYFAVQQKLTQYYK